MNESPVSGAELREQADALHLHGLLAHWAEVMGQPEQARWVAALLGWEAQERTRRSKGLSFKRFRPYAERNDPTLLLPI